MPRTCTTCKKTFTHSPEPWKPGTDGLIFDARNEYVTDTCGTSLPEGEENQKRIVACVNAMQGVDDPEAEIARLKTEITRLKEGYDDFR